MTFSFTTSEGINIGDELIRRGLALPAGTPSALENGSRKSYAAVVTSANSSETKLEEPVVENEKNGANAESENVSATP